MIRVRSHGGRLIVGTLWIAAIAVLLGLCVWQVQRRAWKLDLIAHVDAGLKAAPIAAPATANPGDTYRRVFVSGVFLKNCDSFVQASTIHGPGWWVMTPLRTNNGTAVMINRGFVADRHSGAVSGTATRISGLLRLTEPGGGFLRSNDPAADRWYSRDVAAIAKRRGVSNVAPYFIDADATDIPGQPIGGLTVINFPNNHLVYAITWFILAIMAFAGFIYWIALHRRRGAGKIG
ncbi:SURF1 family protein [soil metagenome]